MIVHHEGKPVYRIRKDGELDQRYKYSKNKVVKHNIKRQVAKREEKPMFSKFGCFLILLISGLIIVNIIRSRERPELLKPVVEMKEVKAAVIEEIKEPSIEEIICSYDWDCGTAVRLFKSENGYHMRGYWNPNVEYRGNLDGTIDTGVVQANSSHLVGLCSDMTFEDLHQKEPNIECGYRVYEDRKSWDTNGFNAWTNFREGWY